MLRQKSTRVRMFLNRLRGSQTVHTAEQTRYHAQFNGAFLVNNNERGNKNNKTLHQLKNITSSEDQKQLHSL